MKIILTQEVTGLGQPGDVVEVKDGYGRNYLLPRNVGDPLDPRRREDRRVDQEGPRLARGPRPGPRRRDQGQARGRPGRRQGQGRHGRPPVRRGDHRRDRRRARRGHRGEVDRRTIALANPIKTLGAHSVSVRLHDDVSATVALNVIPA